MRYWLSYDLGLRGRYEELYAWLDGVEAKECGENVATFLSNKSRDQLTKELAQFVDKTARLYLINMKFGITEHSVWLTGSLETF